MVKNHIKTLAVPRTWPVERKNKVWITRPNSGSNKMDSSMSLNTILKELIKVAATSKDIKYLLNHNDIYVDGKKTKEPRFGVGVGSTISIPSTKKYYRFAFGKFGKLVVLEIPEAEVGLKAVKLVNKHYLKGKMQLCLNDGRNILIPENKYSIGDSLLIELPSQKILKHLPLEKGAYVSLIGGKHLGAHGKVEDIQGSQITFKSEKRLIKTLAEYALVVGVGKSEITISEKNTKNE